MLIYDLIKIDFYDLQLSGELNYDCYLDKKLNKRLDPKKPRKFIHSSKHEGVRENLHICALKNSFQRIEKEEVKTQRRQTNFFII